MVVVYHYAFYLELMRKEVWLHAVVQGRPNTVRQLFWFIVLFAFTLHIWAEWLAFVFLRPCGHCFGPTPPTCRE